MGRFSRNPFKSVSNAVTTAVNQTVKAADKTVGSYSDIATGKANASDWARVMGLPTAALQNPLIGGILGKSPGTPSSPTPDAPGAIQAPPPPPDLQAAGRATESLASTEQMRRRRGVGLFGDLAQSSETTAYLGGYRPFFGGVGYKSVLGG